MKTVEVTAVTETEYIPAQVRRQPFRTTFFRARTACRPRRGLTRLPDHSHAARRRANPPRQGKYCAELQAQCHSKSGPDLPQDWTGLGPNPDPEQREWRLNWTRLQELLRLVAIIVNRKKKERK